MVFKLVGLPGEEAQEEETSLVRGMGAGAKNFLTGLLDVGMQAFGGGENSIMAQHERSMRQMDKIARNLRQIELEEEGLSPEEALQVVLEEKGPERPEPISLEEGIDRLTGGTFLPKTATERTLAKAGKTGGEFLGINMLMPGGGTLGSLAKEGALGALFGTGEQVAEEAGLGKVDQFLSGLGLAASPSLLKGVGKLGRRGLQAGKELLSPSKKLPAKPAFLMEKGTEKALADLELTGKDVAGRISKFSEEQIDQFDKKLSKIAKPSFEEMTSFRTADIENQIVKANKKGILDSISKAPETKKKSWELIKNQVEERFNNLKEQYSKLYEVVQNKGQTIRSIPFHTLERSKSIYDQLQQTLRQKTLRQIPEESGVSKILSDIIERINPHQAGFRDANLAELIATKRSINRVMQTDVIPSVKDLLKPVNAALKEDIAAALKGSPKLARQYQEAEKLFKRAQDLYNNDTILKLRRTESPEKMGELFTSPSSLQRLNEAIGKKNPIKNLADRMVVEEIGKKSTEHARELSREMRQFMSEKANKGLQKLLEHGDKLTSKGAQNIARGNLLSDLQKSFEAGSRPEFALKMMQSPKGYRFVEENLRKSKQGKKMWNSLKRLGVEDLFSTISKEGKIDFEKAKDLLKDPHVRRMVTDAMGKDGLRFFQNLENYGKNFAHNLRLINARQPNLVQSIFKKVAAKEVLMPLAFIMPKAALPLLAIEGGKYLRRAKLSKMLQDPAARRIVKELGSKKSYSSDSLKNLLKRFVFVMREEKSE